MLTIRTGIAECLDESAHTSIAARLAEMQGQPFVPVQAAVLPGKGAAMAPQAGPPGAEPMPSLLTEAELAKLPEASLMPFDPTGRFAQAVPFGLEKYLELVDTMGRAVHRRKRGAIAPATPPLLRRLGMDGEGFIACADHFFKTFASAVGTPARLIALAAQRQTRTLRGLAAARRVFEGGGAVQRGVGPEPACARPLNRCRQARSNH